MTRPIVPVLALVLFATSFAPPQSQRVLTTADYDRAVRMLAPNVNSLVVGGTVSATWLPDGRFWYVRTTTAGTENVVVDPVKKTREVVATPPSGGQAAPGAAGRGGRAGGVPGGGRGGLTINKTCGPNVTGRTGPPPPSMSPNGTRAIFICDWNLWVRDVATGQDRQLTTDGQVNFGYATSNAGWTTSAAAALSWSPDGRKIVTQQQDERKVGDMYLVETPVNGGHPVLRAWKYPLPGDPDVAMISRVAIDVDTGKMTRLLMGPDFHRAMSEDDIDMGEYLWSPDGTRLGFVSTDRYHKWSTAKLADVTTGEVRTLFTETEKTHVQTRVQWRILWDSNEVLWYSQRDGTAQMFLYDLKTGQVKNQITSGVGPITRIARLDTATRTMWYEAVGKEKGQDPYFTHLYKVGLDGKNHVSLTPDNGTHAVQVSPDGKYVIDTFSQPDVAPETVLRDGTTGALVMPLEKADISRLLAYGWKPPMQIKMTAADGKTEIYGVLFRPTNFDPNRKYPIINQAYPGPQSGSVGSRAFSAARGDRQALAELGFVVVSIDGTGTPNRSKAYTDAYYGAMGRHNTIPDQIAGMKELAKRFPWIDIDKTAMWGHSGGGFITADALLRAPYNDFFKVGISESGNHDQRQYEDDWGERYQGPLVKNADGTDNYTIEATQTHAAGLKGRLFLIHGGMDNNVPPFNTYLVADALIKANKDFDLLVIPNAGHGFGAASDYVMRRRWDYFVRHLLGAEPPRDYAIPSAPAGAGRRGGGPGDATSLATLNAGQQTGTTNPTAQTPQTAAPRRTEAQAREAADRNRRERELQRQRTGAPVELISNYLKANILPVPASLGVNPFYTKYVDAMGIPVISSDKVPDEALLVARDIINSMLAKRPDLRAALVARKWRTGVIAEVEMTMDIPEYSRMKRPGAPRDEPVTQEDRDYHANRSRGLGGNPTTGAEENLLGYLGTRYYGEHIFVHEFAHAIMGGGIRDVDPKMHAEIGDAYKAAMAAGKYVHPNKNKHYAATNAGEYWAEGVQWWFFSNFGECFAGNIRVDTPEEFAAYDPTLNELISRVFDSHRIPMDVFHGKQQRKLNCGPTSGGGR